MYYPTLLYPTLPRLMPRTPDPEVGGSSPTRVKPCCVLEQGTFTPQNVLVIPRKRWLCPNMTEKLFTWKLPHPTYPTLLPTPPYPSLPYPTPPFPTLPFPSALIICTTLPLPYPLPYPTLPLCSDHLYYSTPHHPPTIPYPPAYPTPTLPYPYTTLPYPTPLCPTLLYPTKG